MTLRTLRPLLVLTLMSALGPLACGGSAPEAPEPPADPDAAPAFLAVARQPSPTDGVDTAVVQQMLTSGPATAFAPDSSFYLAIHRRELGRRWFLSAYLKQFFPDAVLAGAARSLGTRVVSFRIQNGKLFVFDVDDRKQTSDTFGGDAVVDAFPLVDAAKVAPGKPLKDYVLVDPAAGLNRFGVVDDRFGGGYLGPLNRFMVELAFSQNFRDIKDGATFEQAFTGYTQLPRGNLDGVETNFFRASGVLGLALRRYAEGEGFSSSPMPSIPYFFSSVPRLVPNAGEREVPVAKWNVRRGGKPIRWLISPLVQQASQNPEIAALGIDMLAVVKAGIESWNVAFGFPAMEAELASPDDSFADDDKNYFIWDTNPTVGFAFANWRVNPNSGEIRGASVYFNTVFVDGALASFADPAAARPRRLCRGRHAGQPTHRWSGSRSRRSRSATCIPPRWRLARQGADVRRWASHHPQGAGGKGHRGGSGA